MEWRDRNGLMDLGHKYPEKNYILLLPNDEEINSKDLIKYNAFCHDHLICRIFNPSQYELCKESNVKFYFGMPAVSFQQLINAKEKGAAFCYISAPLTNNLEKASKIGIPLMTYANYACDLFPSAESNPCGNWIRPEDMEIYDKYISIIGFVSKDLQQERGFYRAYAEVKRWGGQLGDLIYGLNYEANNDLIPPDLAQIRIKCGQSCMERNHACKACIRYLDLANKDLIRIAKNMTNGIDDFNKPVQNKVEVDFE